MSLLADIKDRSYSSRCLVADLLEDEEIRDDLAKALELAHPDRDRRVSFNAIADELHKRGYRCNKDAVRRHVRQLCTCFR